MKLSILVTHYNEPFKTCKFLFDSIATQRGVDFHEIEVLVGNDGGTLPLRANDFKGYPYTVKVYNLQHKGVSATRNQLIDLSEGEYIILCDCDDGFNQNFGLHLLMSKMKSSPDMIVSTFIEENIIDGEYRLLRHEKDMTFIHGKAYRKAFLDEKKIRFNNDLTIHEDGYFNTLCAIEAESSETIDNPYYVWCWNGDSVVRKGNDPLFLMKTYPNLLKARDAVCEQLKNRGYVAEYFDAVAKSVIDAYYEAQKPEYLKRNNSQYTKIMERAFKEFYNKYGEDYKACNIGRIAEIMAIGRNNAYAHGMRVEQKTINEWLTHIAKAYKNV